MGQVMLVTLGLKYIRANGLFTLTSGQINVDPIRGGASGALVNGGLEGFVCSARHAIYLGADKGEWMAEMGSETANHFDHVHIATNGGGYPTGNEKYYI